MKMAKRCVQVLCLILSSVSAYAAVTWHVAPEGDDVNNTGAGWDSPYATVAKAVQEAAAGDEVVVSNGVYTLTQQILVDKAITVRSLNGAAETTLDGGPNNTTTRIFFINHADAKVDGFTIKQGYGSVVAGLGSDGGNNLGGVYRVGGGVLLTSGLLANSMIVTNNAEEGAGVYYAGNSSIVSNCLVQGNDATRYGGGLANSRYNPLQGGLGGKLFNNTVRNNSAPFGGSGVWIDFGHMENNIVAYNTGSGGIRQRGGTNRNSLVYRNLIGSGSYSGGGIYLSHTGLIENNTIVYNGGGNSGTASRSSALRCDPNEYNVIRNTIVWGNTYNAAGAEVKLENLSSMTYSCWLAGTTGTGNITSNPAFVNATANNFNLGALSPCLNLGQNQDWMTGATDVAGKDRIINTTVDMGAYERENNLGVGFTANVTSGFAPLEVVFTSVVVGDTTGLTYYWSFNDGGTTTNLQGAGLGTVTHVYGPGSFTAAVTVNNANAEVAAYVLPTTITVGLEHTYAAPGGGNIAPYDTWAKAAHSIADALAYSSDGTTLTVGNGTYTLSQQLVVDKAVTVRSLNGAAATTVDGNNATRVFRIAHANAVVDGFTIKNGVGSVVSGYGTTGVSVGGGVLLGGGLLANCSVLTNNAAEGAGVYFMGNASVVSNCLVQGNVATAGGGGLGNASQAGGRLYGNKVFHNQAEAAGGAGVLINDGYMENNTVAYNKRGGGVRQRGGINVNSLIYRNTSEAGDTGGGLYVSPMYIGGPAVVRNNTVVFNDGRGTNPNANVRTAGLRANQEGANETTTIINTIAFGNLYRSNGSDMLLGVPGQATYSCWPAGTTGTGNVALDPQFRNPTADNFSISSSSPCVDKGLNQEWMATATDAAGMPRIFRSFVDMGALEDNLPYATVLTVR